MKVEEKV